MADDEISELKQDYAKERAVSLQCRHGADVLHELVNYYHIHASYNDNYFVVSVHNGKTVQNDFAVDIMRDTNSPFLFNGKEIVEKIMLDRLVDAIKQGAKEFADEHPEMRRKETAHADEE